MSGFTLAELAARVGGQVVGDGGRRLVGVRTLDEASDEHLSFYHNRRYLKSALASRAGALLVESAGPFAGRDLLVCVNPYLALAEILELYYPPRRPPSGIHPSAVVAASAHFGADCAVGACAVVGERAAIGERVVIGPGCVLGDDVEVGSDTVLHPHVVVEERCRVGARCIFHAGVVIGSDGFGFATAGGVHRKLLQVGTVVVEDDVELGANVCVDRAALGETRVGRGTKVDNLVQIAHNVRVGAHGLLVAGVAIAGSTVLGDRVTMAGQSGAVGHIHIADGTVVTAKTGVTLDTQPGEMVSGFPSRPHREWLRAMANLYQIDELRQRLAALEDLVKGGGKHGDG